MTTLQRIRGADVALAITADGDLQTSLTAIESFNTIFKFEKLVQRYLGEQTVRTDEIYGGIEGKMKLHLYTEDFANFILNLQLRARRLSPSITFNVVATMNFPNGDTPVISYPDINIGDIPLDMANAKDYVAMDLDFIAGEFDIQL